jgi:hypothetical protein
VLLYYIYGELNDAEWQLDNFVLLNVIMTSGIVVSAIMPFQQKFGVIKITTVI